MGPQSERFEMRLDPDLLSRIDTWRGKQDDIPSRAEAIRRLVEVALANIGMKDSEKLILTLLCNMYKSMGIKDRNYGLDPDFILEAIRGGHYWGLKWKYEGLLHNYFDNEQTLREVVDILDMWSFLEEAINVLSPEDKDYIKTKADYSAEQIKFGGFDGNNEHEHLNLAHFLINEMERFTEFKDRGGHKGDLNCHYPSLDVHRRMLEVFNPLRKTLSGRRLNAKEIVEIVKARVHSSMR
jgi:uncharacterized protein YfbU (UPF0304 family)